MGRQLLVGLSNPRHLVRRPPCPPSAPAVLVRVVIYPPFDAAVEDAFGLTPAERLVLTASAATGPTRDGEAEG